MASSKRNSPPDGKSRHASLAAEDDEFVYAVCEQFFHCMMEGQAPNATETKRRRGPAPAIVDWLVRERGRNDITREKIYPLIWQAFKRGFLLLKAPTKLKLRDRLVEKYALESHLASNDGAADSARQLVVVNVSGPTASRNVGAVAADEIIKLIHRVDAEKRAQAVAEGGDPNQVRVHLGFGAGYAAMEVANRLAERADARTPKLTLHAITPGGFYIAKQEMNPTLYFNYFNKAGLDVECVGLFSTPVVATEDFERLKQNPSLHRCFEKRDEIDILFTSLATADDKDGLFRQYFEYLLGENLVDENELKTLEAQGWVGDILFQPYSATGALTPKPYRAVSLFTFDELAEFSRRPGKHVVVIGGPCGACGAPKTNALRPLFANEQTRLWTQLIIDRDAALALLDEDAASDD